MEPFIAQISMFGGNFAPRDWALCNGQLISIQTNEALFSIVGTIYGGDGRTTFALPDLRGRVSIHPGSGPGLTTYQVGQKGGAETVTLTTAQMPAHRHTVNCFNQQGDKALSAGNYPATSRNADDIYDEAKDSTMNADMLDQTGGGQAHENRQPFLCVNYIIALVGIYPSRN